MTDVEYTEKAIGHLENLDSQVADRVMNKVDEATDWTDTASNRFRGIRTTNSGLEIIASSSRGTGVTTFSASRPSVTVGISTTAIFHRRMASQATNGRTNFQTSEFGRLTVEKTVRSAAERTPATPFFCERE